MKRLLDLLWLVLLGVFIMAGVPIVSYHGDESYHIYTSNDFDTAILKGRPQDLMVHTLWENDQAYQRLLNGELTRYFIGVGWWTAGLTVDYLPDSGYLFGENYDQNVGRGLVPLPEHMIIFRDPVALCFVFSVGVMFLLGKLYGGRPLAYFVSGLYAINPVTLLNGRRAMQESPLLLFGLLTVYIALVIAQKREGGIPVRWKLWTGLVLSGALTFAAKQSGIVYVIPAYLAIFIPELLRLKLRPIIAITWRLAVCTILTCLLFFVITPGIWYDPLARLQDMIDGRIGVMNSQVDLDPLAPTSLEYRALDIIRQPFMMPPQHYELEPVRYSAAQDNQIYEYMRSPLSGLQFGLFLGGALTLMAGVGLVASAIPRLRPYKSWALSLGLYIWLAGNVITLMQTPLPWQRYSLSLIPIVTLFSGIGIQSVVRLLLTRRQRRRSAPSRQPSYA